MNNTGKWKLVFMSMLISFIPEITAQSDKTLAENGKSPLLKKYQDYEAVILEDLGSIRFKDNNDGAFDVIYTRSTQYKIITTSGLSWAEIEIPLYDNGSKKEFLQDISITVINPGDDEVKKFKMKELDVYTEDYSRYYIKKKVAVPGAKEGSLFQIDYSYRSPLLYNLRDWIFQYSIPVLFSQFSITIMPFYEYALLKRGEKTLDSFYKYDSKEKKQYGSATYQERTYMYVMTDISAFDDESFITNKADYINRLEFQLRGVTNTYGITTPVMTDWQAVNKELLDHKDFGKYISSSERISKTEAKLFAELFSNQEELADVVAAFVKNNVKWNQLNSKFASESIKKVLETREGNSADINLYLTGMLKAAGLDAFPVLLSTRAHGKVFKDSPLHTNFNYVVAGIKSDSGILLRDATAPHYPSNQLPIRCLNGNGLAVLKGIEEWIPLSSGAVKGRVFHSVKLDLQADSDDFSSTVVITSTGYDAIKYIGRTGNDPEEAKEIYTSNLFPELDSISLQAGKIQEDSFSITILTDIPKESIGEHIFIQPFAGLPEKECPLTKETRSYPVDMVYQRSNFFRSEISIPEGYRASFVPENYIVRNDLLTVRYSSIQSGEKLWIDAELTFKKRIYQPKDYAQLRYFYKDMVKRLNEKIILEADEQVRP